MYWPTTTYTTEEVARRLKDVPLGGAFRGQYAYDNILFGVAQQLIEKESGQTFQAFLDSRILGESLGRVVLSKLLLGGLILRLCLL